MSDANTGGASSPGAPKRRWIKPLLIVSLAFNLLFVGLVAGSFWKFRHGKGWVPRHRAFEATIEQVITEMPDKRATAEDVLARLRSDVIPRARGYRAARKAVIDALLADPYSEERLREAMAELRAIRSDVLTGMHTLALDLVRDMSAAERRRLLEIFRSKRHPRRKWRMWRQEKKQP